MEELKPCPFCGGEADEYEGDYGNGIYCMMCGAMVGEPIHLEYRTTKRVSIAEAVAAWNTRAERTCRDVNEDDHDFTCSDCGASMYTWIDDCWTMIAQGGLCDDVIEHPKFCPNCGAKVVD